MSVLIRFADGLDQEFSTATAAVVDGSRYRVVGWDPELGRIVEIAALPIEDVALGEVSKDGVVTELVPGLGRRAEGP